MEELLAQIRAELRAGNFRITEHGLQEILADGLSAAELIDGILNRQAEVVEDYPGDSRGASCLVATWTRGGEPVHVVFSYPPRPKMITAYRLDPKKWLDYKTRRRS